MEADSRKYPGYAFDKFENKETEEPGFVPGIAPEFFRIGGLFKDPNWGGACVMTPWYYYQEYGDVNILRQNFGLMQSYVDHLERRSVNGVLKEYAQMVGRSRAVQIIGPASPSVGKVKDVYRRVIYLKQADAHILIDMKNKMEQYIEVNSGFAKMRIQFDFDPMKVF